MPKVRAHDGRKIRQSAAAGRTAQRVEAYAFTVFQRVFREVGLPKAIRTDNGVPSPVPKPCSA
jgi:hypothetical protein